MICKYLTRTNNTNQNQQNSIDIKQYSTKLTKLPCINPHQSKSTQINQGQPRYIWIRQLQQFK